MLSTSILPLPVAGPRKLTRKGRKRVKSRILTSTPVKEQLELAKKMKPVEKTKRKLISVESDDAEKIVADSNVADIPGADWLTELTEGEYVLVRFAGNKRTLYYVGQIECVDEETGECEAKFLKRCRDDETSGQPTFIFNPGDEGAFPKDDIVMRLPHPEVLGNTKRQKKYIFQKDLLKWMV